MPRIAVIGSHMLACSGIVALLREEDGFQVCGPVGLLDWRSALSPERPDVLLLVSHLSNSVPGQVLRDIRQESPESRLVFVNLVDDDRALLSAVREGAEGVLDFSADPSFLVGCVHDVLNGEMSISRAAAGRLVRDHIAPGSGVGMAGRLEVLTPREVAILRLIAHGESNKAIAYQLSISQHTVRAHARNIMQKLEVANRVQAAAVAFRAGLASS